MCNMKVLYGPMKDVRPVYRGRSVCVYIKKSINIIYRGNIVRVLLIVLLIINIKYGVYT